jgi:hypothetical protein
MSQLSTGFVYVATSPSFAGDVYKIGATKDDPLNRLAQLSASTSAALPFALAYSRRVSSPFEVEAALHRQLAEFRLNSSREFFRVPLHKIITLIEAYEEAPELLAGKRVETPYAELFATFKDNGTPRTLTKKERQACQRLRNQLAK